jgi:MFS family permease
MLRVIIYSLPAFVDLLVGSFFFISTVRMAESGASAVAVSGLPTVWGSTYMLFCPIIGRRVTMKSSVPMMLAGAGAMMLCAGLFILFPDLKVLYVVMAIFGIACALFFPPFMVFMKTTEAGNSRGLIHSTAMYTMSWSIGLAAGPFIAGYVWSIAGWRHVCALDMALALLVGTGVVFVHRRIDRTTAGTGANGGTTAMVNPPYANMPNMILTAWIASGVFLLAIAAVRGVFPSSAVHFGIPKAHQGNVFALICCAQALSAFLLRNSTWWVYRPLPIILFGIIGVAGYVLFGFATTWPLYYAAAICVGFCAGSVFLYLVFHALVHPSNAGRYAGINESIVGLTGIIGPLAGGILADTITIAAPYYAGASVFAAVLVIQALTHAGSARPANPSKAT